MSTNNILNNDISINDLLTLEREVLTSLIDLSFNLTTFITNIIKDLSFNESIKLNNDSTTVIELILTKYPKLLDDMGTHLNKIINDNIINNKDIPEMLLLMTDVLNANTSELNKLKLTRKQVINFVKDIFIILIESNIIKTFSKENKDIIISLLDISIKLLESKVNVKKVINCFFF